MLYVTSYLEIYLASQRKSLLERDKTKKQGSLDLTKQEPV